MRLFRKRKRRRISDNQLLAKANTIIANKQRKTADYLGRKTQYWNRSSKIIALVTFCVLFGGACLLLVIKAIIHL